MVSETDFITIPYSSDLTQGGIQYASHWLQHIHLSKENRQYNHVRDTVARKAVELAFNRHLNQHKIPHTIVRSTPFSDPNSTDVEIGGRRCHIKSFMLNRKKQIRKIHNAPKRLLQAQAIVAANSMDNYLQEDQDFYIFAFLTALITTDTNTLAKAISAGQPTYMLHFLPQKWRQTNYKGSLGRLAIKSNMRNTLRLGLFGKDEHQRPQEDQLILEPLTRTTSNKLFSTLSFCSTADLPDHTVGLHSLNLKDTLLISHTQWGNIWVYGMKIIFAGYITCSDFSIKAVRLPQGSRVFQYTHTREENLGIPIKELHPLNEMFVQAKEWYQIQKS